MGLFDKIFGKKAFVEKQTIKSTVASDAAVVLTPKIAKKITIRELPQYVYSFTPKNITQSKIENKDLKDGDGIVIVYDPEKSENPEFVIRKSEFGDYGSKLGKVPEEIADHLFDLYSYVLEFSSTFSIEIDGKLRILQSDNTKPEVRIDLSIPYDINDQGLPINTKVVGVTYNNRQEYIKQCYFEDGLLIKHVPTEEHPEAFQVIHLSTGNQIGFINKDLATDLVKRFGQGVSFSGCVTRRNSGENGVLGCNIQIMSVNK